MRPVRTVLFPFLLLLLLSATLLSQGTTSNLTGTVLLNGLPRAGASVTISSPTLQGKRTTVTDVNGAYNFAAVPPGEYTIRFEMRGMTTVVKTAKVGLATTARVDATLALATVAEAITVSASKPSVLETTDVTTNLDAQMVAMLPVARTLAAAASMAPGVTVRDNRTSISGAYGYDSLYLVNGAVVNENLFGTPDNLYIEDAIQETSVLTGSVSAEYGRFTGGVVSAITKVGGNEFSGTFRDNLSNPSWDETTPLNEEQEESVLNEVYEATLGGRILRDRLWFFVAAHKSEQALRGFFTSSTVPRPVTAVTDDRWEVKLTGQITPQHSLIGTYLNYEVEQSPYCAFGCFEVSTIDMDGVRKPREMNTLHYNAILTPKLLVEGSYSDRYIEWHGGGTDYLTRDPNDAHDLALGTTAFEIADTEAAWGAPVFCGICDVERRSNRYYLGKATYFVSTQAAGMHRLVAGYENFVESRYANNYQSGSNFLIYTYGVAPEREADGTLRPVIVEGDDIVYTPVIVKSKGSAFKTESLFVNDKWDLGARWSFNLGVRYDRNDGVDSADHLISKDSNISPRLGAIWDILGDRRVRVHAGYSKYVSRIQEAVGGVGGGGNPWYIYYTYSGPQIGGVGTGMGSLEVLESLFSWFLEQGGIEANHLISAARVSGVNTRLTGDLLSPSVDEYTFGFGMRLGNHGILRIDYVTREGKEFYVDATSPDDQVENPILPGTHLDTLTIRNATATDHLERTYQAVELQASYRFTPRLYLAGNYTWSEAKGNTVGESNGLVFPDHIGRYTEYHSFERHNPVGFLPSDQTHKARLWASYDLPIGSGANVNFSVLERFDSGAPYSAVANVNTRPYVTNPGYASMPSGVAYYFSERGAYRWEDATATDVSVSCKVPAFRSLELFVQGKVLNVFNETAQIDGVTGVRVIKRFDPWNEKPLEGTNWVKSPLFGRATTPSHYQAPLTYTFSAGLRF